MTFLKVKVNSNLDKSKSKSNMSTVAAAFLGSVAVALAPDVSPLSGFPFSFGGVPVPVEGKMINMEKLDSVSGNESVTDYEEVNTKKFYNDVCGLPEKCKPILNIKCIKDPDMASMENFQQGLINTLIGDGAYKNFADCLAGENYPNDVVFYWSAKSAWKNKFVGHALLNRLTFQKGQTFAHSDIFHFNAKDGMRSDASNTFPNTLAGVTKYFGGIVEKGAVDILFNQVKETGVFKKGNYKLLYRNCAHFAKVMSRMLQIVGPDMQLKGFSFYTLCHCQEKTATEIIVKKLNQLINNY